MQDLKAKTPNKRKSLANGTPNSKSPKSAEKAQFSPKNNRKQAADFFNGDSTPTEKMNGKKQPQTEKKKENKKDNKRKSLPAKLFENDTSTPAKKAKTDESTPNVPMFGGTGSLESAKKNKKENTPQKGGKTPKKANVEATPAKTVEATPVKVTEPPKKQDGSPKKQAGTATVATSAEKTEKRVHKRNKNKKKKKLVVVPKEENGVALNKRQLIRRKSKLKAVFHQEKVEKLIDLVNKGVKKPDDVQVIMKNKLAELDSRPQLTKTAQRRLRALKKVLNIVQDPNMLKEFENKKEKKEEATVKTAVVEKKVATKTQQRKEKKLKNLVKEQKEENEIWANDLKKTQQSEQQKGKKQQAPKQTQVEQKKANKKSEKTNKNQAKAANVENAKQLNTNKKETKKAEVKKAPVVEQEDSSEESEYEVEKVIKPAKVTKGMNEFEKDTSDEEEGDNEELDDSLENSGFVDQEAESTDGEDEEMEEEEEGEDEEEDDEQDEEEDSEVEVNLKQQEKQKPQKNAKKNNKQVEAVTKNDQMNDNKPEKQKQKGNKPEKNQNKPEKNQNKPEKQIPVQDLQKSGMIQKGQSRYVVFVGNLPYDAQKEEIKSHFLKAGEVQHIRIPTEKGSQRPRGFCYVEFKDEDSYQRALSMHHSFLKNRRINVLYTQGGKKKPEERKKEIKEKNFKLSAMRKQGKLSGSVKENQKRSVRRAKQRNFQKKQQET